MTRRLPADQWGRTVEALPLWEAAEPVQAPCTPLASALQQACEGPNHGISRELRAALAELAERHQGEARAILGDDLAALAGYEGSSGCNGTRVRRLRSDLAASFARISIPVAATTAGGYYVPVNDQEIAHYRADLRSRARQILERALAFERQLDHAGRIDARQRAAALDRLLTHLRAV